MILDLSPQQRKVLKFIEDDVGLVFTHDNRNLEMIRKFMGWERRSSVTDALYNLRGKGYLQSEGESTKKPERWHVIVTEGGV